MNKTKIDWCDSTWNPITGCLHGCEYCYARRIANRFGAGWETASGNFPLLDEPLVSTRGKEPYPYSFTPTFHRRREEIFFLHKEIENVINNQPKIGEWIPCSERLPEELIVFLQNLKVLINGIIQCLKRLQVK